MPPQRRRNKNKNRSQGLNNGSDGYNSAQQQHFKECSDGKTVNSAGPVISMHPLFVGVSTRNMNWPIMWRSIANQYYPTKIISNL